MACLGAEQHEAAEARGARSRLVESESAAGAYLAHGEVKAAAVADLALILLAVVEHALHRNGRVDGVDILGAHIHMVKKNLLEPCQSGGTVGYQWEEFREVEHRDLAEAHLTPLIHADEVGIYVVGGASGAESHHTAATGSHATRYDVGDVTRHISAAVG